MTTRELTNEEIEIIAGAKILEARLKGSEYCISDCIMINDQFVAVKGYEDGDKFNWHFDNLITE